MMKLRIKIFVMILISSCTLEDENNLANTEIQKTREILQAGEYAGSYQYAGSYLHQLYSDLSSQITSTTWTDEPPGKLAGVIFQLNDKNLIEVPDNVRFDINRNWTIEKVGMSKIKSVRLISEDSKNQEYN